MRKAILGVLTAIVVVGGAVLVERSVRVNSNNGAAPDAEQNLPGEISLIDFNSKKTVQLKSFAGKVVLINFWASWCEACMAEMPSIQRLYEQLKNEGFEVIAINVDENPEKVVPGIVKRLNLTFPIFTEKDNEATRAFRVAAIPYSLVADRQQKVVWAEAGEKDWSSTDVVDAIRKLLKPI